MEPNIVIVPLVLLLFYIYIFIFADKKKKVLPSIIDERRTAFMEGRHMLHSVVIANEVVDEAKRCNKSCLVLKVDYEKAYDSMCWDFLLYIMTRMGSCTKWVRSIKGCLKLTSISILVDGSPTNEFIPQRGLRQGDPLVPFLFNIVAEGLTGLMREA